MQEITCKMQITILAGIGTLLCEHAMLPSSNFTSHCNTTGKTSRPHLRPAGVGPTTFGFGGRSQTE